MVILSFLLLIFGSLFLVGTAIFMVLIPFSLSDKARQELPSSFAVLVFPRMYFSKYYSSERLWVRKGFLISSGGLLVSLIFIFTIFIFGGISK